MTLSRDAWGRVANAIAEAVAVKSKQGDQMTKVGKWGNTLVRAEVAGQRGGNFMQARPDLDDAGLPRLRRSLPLRGAPPAQAVDESVGSCRGIAQTVSRIPDILPVCQRVGKEVTN